MNHKELVNQAQDTLDNAGIYNGFAKLLMVEMLQAEDKDLFIVNEEEVKDTFKEKYLHNIELLAQDIPLGYVLGYEWFYGYKIGVNESVLIPRGETEELVGQILMDIDERYINPVIADVATGSGAIALALSKELDVPVFATDISKQALVVAQQNAKELKANVIFKEGDMLEPVIVENMKLDVLVCNPPYIKNTEDIQTAVLNNEPHVALFGGEDGLFFYRKVLEKAALVLKEKGMIAFEIGFDIGEAVVNLASKYFPNAEVKLLQDINGLDRMVFIYT